MCNFFSVSDFSLLDTLIYKVSGRGVLYMCVVLSLAAYAAHLFSHLRTHPLISVICTMCTLEALDILPLKTSLCSVSNLIFHNYTCLHGVSFSRYNKVLYL